MKRLMKLAVAFGLLFGANVAFAQYYDGPGTDDGTEDNTDAGSVVSNVATVTYEVGGVEQEDEANDPATFTVDRVILIDVTAVADDDVAPAATGQALEYTVTNDSNDTIDLVLAASNVGTGDDFNANGLAIYLDDAVDGTQGTYDVEDDLIPANRLTNVAEGTTFTIFVVSSIPNSTVVDDEDTADVVLMATAYDTAGEGGAIIVETGDGAPNDEDVEETVFGDPDGTFDDGLGDTDDAEDGRDSDTATYTVTTASITVAKSSAVISDPFNGVSANAKAIPGAVIEYCILVTNSGGTQADNISVVDPIPENTTYVAESIRIVADCDDAGGGVDDDIVDDAGDEAGSFGSFDAAFDADGVGGNDARGRVLTEVDTLADGDPTPTTTATLFRVTID